MDVAQNLGDTALQPASSLEEVLSLDRGLARADPPPASPAIAAIPAAQAIGLPPKVVEWMIGLGISTSQISAVEMNAESGMTPPPIDLPMHMMSGTTSQWSTPQSLPVRPIPVWISSAMRSSAEAGADLAHPRQVVLRRNHAARLSLHRLDHERRDRRAHLFRLGQLGFERLGIAVRHEAYVLQTAQERLPERGLSHQRQRAHRLAVEAAQRRDEGISPGVRRASLIAPSMASVPLLMKKQFCSSPGVTAEQQPGECGPPRLQQLLAVERHALASGR